MAWTVILEFAVDHRPAHQIPFALGLMVLLIAVPAAVGGTSVETSAPHTVGTPAEAPDVDLGKERIVEGGVVAPGRNAMPTLGELGIIAISVAFGVFGILFLRRDNPARR
jgi:hypothetical protein